MNRSSPQLPTPSNEEVRSRAEAAKEGRVLVKARRDFNNLKKNKGPFLESYDMKNDNELLLGVEQPVDGKPSNKRLVGDDEEEPLVVCELRAKVQRLELANADLKQKLLASERSRVRREVEHSILASEFRSHVRDLESDLATEEWCGQVRQMLRDERRRCRTKDRADVLRSRHEREMREKEVCIEALREELNDGAREVVQRLETTLAEKAHQMAQQHESHPNAFGDASVPLLNGKLDTSSLNSRTIVTAAPFPRRKRSKKGNSSHARSA